MCMYYWTIPVWEVDMMQFQYLSRNEKYTVDVSQLWDEALQFWITEENLQTGTQGLQPSAPNIWYTSFNDIYSHRSSNLIIS